MEHIMLVNEVEYAIIERYRNAHYGIKGIVLNTLELPATVSAMQIHKDIINDCNERERDGKIRDFMRVQQERIKQLKLEGHKDVCVFFDGNLKQYQTYFNYRPEKKNVGGGKHDE